MKSLKKTINFLIRQKDQIDQGGYSELKRKLKLIFPKLLSAPFYIMGSPFALLIFITMRVMKPFFVIRLEKFTSHRIGHFTANIEIYLLETELGINVPSKPFFDIWFHSQVISNKQLATMWSRILYVGPRRIMNMVYKLNALVPDGTIHRVNKPISLEPPKNFLDYRKKTIYYSPSLDNTPPHLSFLPDEEKRGEATLRDMGIPEGAPFVALIVRDSAYLTHQSESLNLKVDWSYHDYRDCDVQNYILAAEELAERGYYVIRMGAVVKEAMDVDHPMIIDYATNGMRSDFMDVYLGAKCTFCISNGTGYEGIPYLFRKPILFIDHVPLGDINTYNQKCLITTKKHWLRDKNRFMTFGEIFASAAIFQRTQEFEDLGIDLIDSTPEETKAAVIEMLERLAGSWETTAEDEALQDKFWELFPRGTEDFGVSHGEIRSRMGADFLRHNRDLIINSDRVLDSDKDTNRFDEVNESSPLDRADDLPSQPSLRYVAIFKRLIVTLFSTDINKSNIFISKVFVETINKLFIPVGIILYLIMLMIKPLILIRVGKMRSERIGHFAADTELYLCEQDQSINKPDMTHLDLWYDTFPVCNHQLATMWSRILRVGPRWLLTPLDTIISLLPNQSGSHKINSISDVDRDVHHLLDNTPPHLSFLPDEEKRGEATLRDMGIPEGAPFVVLIVRDSAYLDHQIPWRTWSYHDHRDCDVQNYILAAEELAERGYYVIRMGAVVKEAMDVDHPMIIDYATNGMRSDFMDVYLGAKCTFCISNGTGYDAVPQIFRKPILYIDYIPLVAINTYNKNVISTTKKHWLRDKNRFMTFGEIFNDLEKEQNDPFNLHESPNIDLIESTPEETKAAVIEMLERLAGSWETTAEDEALQDKFWELFPRGTEDFGVSHGEIRSRMGADFLRRTKKLL